MKQILYIIITLLSILGINAQNGSNNNENGALLPTITPPSPEAFAITKYGDMPINEFSGMVNLTIPIHTYKAGKLEVPVSLNYSEAGLKIDDIPTKTGMGWVLKTGGVITRTVKNLPDELMGISGRIFHTPQEYIDFNTEDGTSGATLLSNYINSTNTYDLEADIFTYNFNGYSGSFYLDQNLNPVLIKEESELKITRVGDLWTDKEFLITTPDGVKYLFGGTNGYETTTKPHDNSIQAPTSYHLMQMTHPINGVINFEYYTCQQNATLLGLNESMTFLGENDYPTEPFLVETPEFPLGTTVICDPPGKLPVLKVSSQIIKNNNIRHIKRIYSLDTNESINFNYNIITNNFYILDNIEIRSLLNGNDSVIKDVNLEYLGIEAYTIDSAKRFFLNEVIFNDFSSLNNKKERWKLEYDNYLQVPNRCTFSQDEAGYYNGANNTTLLSSETLVLNNNPFNPLYEFQGADRSANINYAKKGALNKITYPTGGFTTFEYECLPKKQSVMTNYKLSINVGQLEDPDNETPENSYGSIPNNEEGSINQVFPYISHDQQVTFKLKSTRSFQNTQSRSFIYKITNVTDGIVMNNEVVGYGYNNPIYELTLLLQKNKEYKIELQDIPPLIPLQNFTLYSCTVNFDISDYELGDAPGLRVKREIDYTSEGVVSNYKRFYYMPFAHFNLPVADRPIPERIRYLKDRFSLIYIAACQAYDTHATYPYYSFYTTICSYPVNSIFQNQINTYKNVVTSFGGENFEKGGVERYYHKEEDPNQGDQVLAQMTIVGNSNENFSNEIATNDFFDKTGNISMFNGDLIKEIYFKKDTDQFTKLKMAEYTYDKQFYSGYTNFVGKKVYNPFYYPDDSYVNKTTSNYFLKIYRTMILRNKLISKKETTYFDPVSMPVAIFDSIYEPDESLAHKIINRQDYSYGNLRGLPTEISTQTSDSNLLNRTVHHYADENMIQNGIGLTSSQSDACVKLVAMNNIASPIQTEQYKGTALLSTQRTLYKQLDPLNDNSIVPDKIQTSKGSNSVEDRAEFIEYDVKGNPSIVKLTKGSKTKYFYNQYNQVTIKIENYLGGLNNFNNPFDGQSPCGFQLQFPNSMITVYNYDNSTHQITSIISPNCKKTYYEYNEINQLVRILDDDKNIIQEFDHNYKPQN